MNKSFEEIADIDGFLNRIKRGIAYTVLAAMGYFGLGCGDNGNGGGDTTGPDITVETLIEDSYEGNQTITATVTDPSNVQSVSFQYRAVGSADAYTVPNPNMTNTSGDIWDIDFVWPADELEYRVVATDDLGNESDVSDVVRKYADEPKEDVELPDKFASYSDVLDYGVNDPNGIDVGGSMIYPDWWALIEDPSHPGDPDYGYFVVGWYQGPSDDDHTAEKQLCEDYYVPWAQINPCPQDEIGPKLDEIRAAGWASGQTKGIKKKAKEQPEEFF